MSSSLPHQVEELLRTAMKQVSNNAPTSLPTDKRVTELGLDSVALMEMVGMLEEEIGEPFDERQLSEVVTVGDLGSLVARGLQSRQKSVAS